MKGKVKKLVVGGIVAMSLGLGMGTLNVPIRKDVGVVEASSKKATLNRKKLTLKVGKTFKLKVKNGGKVKKWKSSKKKVVTVTKTGKLKAKKVGKAKITAVLKTGKKLYCNVTVKKTTGGGESKSEVSSRVLPNGKKQSIDSIRLRGIIVGGYSYIEKNCAVISHTLYDTYYATSVSADVTTTNIPANKLSYKWEVSNTKVFEISGEDNKKTVKLRPMNAGSTYISVTVSYDGLSKTFKDKYKLIDEEDFQQKAGIQEPDKENVIYMVHTVKTSLGKDADVIFFTGSDINEEKDFLVKNSPEFKRFLNEYYEPVKNGTELERLNAIYRFLVDSGYSYNESMYDAISSTCYYSLNLVVQKGGPRKAWSGGFWYLCYLSGLSCMTIEDETGYSWNGLYVDGHIFCIDPLYFSAECARKYPNEKLTIYQLGNKKAFRELTGKEHVLQSGQMSDNESMGPGREYLYSFYQEEYPQVLTIDVAKKTITKNPAY